MYFVIVDAYSKYLQMKTDATSTMEQLTHLSSTFGLPEHVVSDNEPQFIGEEFKTFLQKNDIQHTRTQGMGGSVMQLISICMIKCFIHHNHPINLSCFYNYYFFVFS